MAQTSMVSPAETTGPVAAEPSIVVIFGITGDLAQHKLLPALYHLIKNNLLHDKTVIVGVSRRDVSTRELLSKTELCILEANNTCDPVALKKMHDKVSMFTMDNTSGDDYDRLHEYLDQLETDAGVCLNRLYYLSVPPQVYAPIIRHLGERGLQSGCAHGSATSRLLIEKPFGYDLASARELIDTLTTHFQEEQIYRIDHYLAKETAQNIMTFRFQNPLFAAIWNRRHISRIDIAAAETIGIEDRANFYDNMGALRDFIQSHLLQLLAITTMEPPASLHSDDIHAARLQLLQAIQPVPADQIDRQAVRAQYAGYADDAKNPGSTTETFAAVQLFIDNERWQGVPMTLRTGKKLAQKATTITLTFASESAEVLPNRFRFDLQPHEGIAVDLQVKRPGFASTVDTATMDFSYQRTYDETGHPDAYERVLVDAIRGDRTLFTTSDEVLAAWQAVQPVLSAWQQTTAIPASYQPGSDIDTVAGPLANQ